MSKNWSDGLTSARRAELAKLVKPLRQATGLSKKVVYEEAQISRQTLDNIENGTTVPQVDVLLRVLDVVGYEVEESIFTDQTEQWLAMIGSLIEALPEGRRPAAVDRVIRALALERRHVTAGLVELRAPETSAPVEAVDELLHIGRVDASDLELLAAETEEQD